MKYTIQILTLFLMIINTEMFSQCGCPEAAPAIVISNIGGSTDLGAIDNDKLRITSFYKTSRGNKIFDGSSEIDNRFSNNFYYNYFGLNLGYAINYKWTTEWETGYYLNKKQDFDQTSYIWEGFSNTVLSVKYNLFRNFYNTSEYTIGAGVKLPLSNRSQKSGSYGMVLHSFWHNKLDFWDLHTFLINRFELNLLKNNDYLTGQTFITSAFFLKQITSNLYGMFELRNEIKTKDKYDSTFIENSGNILLIASPQISYNFSGFNVGLLIEYPLYKYYYGKQIAPGLSFGVNFSTKM